MVGKKKVAAKRPLRMASKGQQKQFDKKRAEMLGPLARSGTSTATSSLYNTMQAPTKPKPSAPTKGKARSNKGGAVRGKARAAEVKRGNAVRKAAVKKKVGKKKVGKKKTAAKRKPRLMVSASKKRSR